MLEKTHFTFARGADRCALVTGAETVSIWHFPIDEWTDADREGAPPSLTIEANRSRIEGIAFVGPDQLLTVHQLGECVLWDLPEPDADQLPAKTDASGDGAGEEMAEGTAATAESTASVADEAWTGDLGLEICAFTARSDEKGFARSAAIGARTGEVVLFDLSAETPTLALADGHATDVTQLTFDPHGYRLASGGRDRRIVLWSTDPESFAPLEDASDQSSDTSDAPDSSPSSDASDASAPDDDSSEGPSPADRREAARELASHELRRLNTLEGSQGWPLAIAFSHDEQRVATTALDNALYLWDPAADDPLIGVVSRHHNWVTEVAFSPDDTRLATGSWDSTVHIVEAESLSPEYRFDIHTDFVSGLTFMPDSDRLVSTSYDGTVAVWNWRDGELVRQIEAHADWVEVLALIDDKRVLTVSSEDVIRLWDVASGEKLAELGDASFEGFHLGRDVDFSSYVEVPELASDELGEGREPVAAVKAVEQFDERNRVQTEGGGEQTAVGLLEDAIDEGAMPASDRELEQEAEAGGEGTAMLESHLEESDDDADATRSVDEIGEDVEQVDAAFAEISDVEAEKQDEETGGEQTGPETADLLDDRDLKSSVANVGDKIDERVEEESLDVSADLDEPEEDADTDGGQPLDDVGVDVEPDDQPSPDTPPADGEEATDDRPETSDGGVDDEGDAEESGEETNQKPEKDPDDASTGEEAANNERETGVERDTETAEDRAESTEEPDWDIDAGADDTESAAAEDDEQTSADGADASETDGDGPSLPSPEETGPPAEPERDDEPLGEGASPQLGAPVDEADNQQDDIAPDATLQGPPDSVVSVDSDEGSTDDTQPSSDEADASVSAGGDTTGADEGDASDVDPDSTLMGTPEQHTSEMAEEAEKDEQQLSSDTEFSAKPGGGRLSPPGEGDDSSGPSPEDIPTPDAQTDPGEVGLDENETPSRDVGPADQTEQPPADSGAPVDDREADEADSVADEPTEPTELDDPDEASTSEPESRPGTARTDEDASGDDATAESPADDQKGAPDRTESTDENEASRTSDAAELTSKLERLRDKKQSTDREDEAGEASEPSVPDAETEREIHEASAAEMWEHRSEVAEASEGLSDGREEQTEAVADGAFKLRHAFETPHRRVQGITALPGSDLVGTCGADGSACLWTLGGRRRLTLTSEEAELNAIAFTPDGRILAAASSDGHIHLWMLPDSLKNPDSPIRHTRLEDHADGVTGVDIDASGKLLLSGSRDGTARIWSLVDAACMAVLDNHQGRVVDVSWGKLPVTAGADGTIRYWDQEGRPINQSTGFGDITSVATHETTTCWGTDAGQIYARTTGQPEQRRGHEGPARDVDFGPRGLMTTGGADGVLYIYGADETEPRQQLQSEAPLASVFVRNNLIGAGGDDSRVYLYSRG